VFFLALLVMQIPVGLMFDRIGARRTVSGLSVLAVAGAVMLARADSPASHLVARTVVGVGCAASFMSAVFLVSRWFPPERLSTSLSWVFAASNVGTLVAATPLAWASATIGWRNGFLLLGVVTALAAVAFFALVRDLPPGVPAPGNRTETAGDVLKGLLAVWKTPGLLPVLAMHTFAYAVMLTVLGVWAGPYLHAVHGLDSIARGHVMLGMGAAQIVGILCYGPLDRLLNSRKKAVIAGVLATTLVLAGLSGFSHPPLWLAVGLLVALTFFASYGIIIVAQGRSLFPAHLAGRGVTTVNMAQVLGCMVLPAASGYVVSGFTPAGGVAPEIAFRAVFAMLGLCNLIGLAVYLRSPDSKPMG
jgi:predicted MFS family arabinose efflux permease